MDRLNNTVEELERQVAADEITQEEFDREMLARHQEINHPAEEAAETAT